MFFPRFFFVKLVPRQFDFDLINVTHNNVDEIFNYIHCNNIIIKENSKICKEGGYSHSVFFVLIFETGGNFYKKLPYREIN